jgi:SOS response regulatory protein OraA/RecX
MATTEPVKITGIRAISGGAKLQITAKTDEGMASVAVYAARLTALPRCGEIPPAQWETYLNEGAYCHAMELALHKLAGHTTSPTHLKAHLLAKGVSLEMAETVLRELADRHTLDEERGALAEAERALAKYWGNRRILLHIRSKGYGEEALRAVSLRLREENSRHRLSEFLRRRRVRVPQSEAERRRLIASLVRYGYSAREIESVLEEMKPCREA